MGPGWVPRGRSLQLLASWLLAQPRSHLEASRDSESLLRAHGGGPRQWVPGSAQYSEGQREQYCGPGPSGTGKDDPLNPVRPSQPDPNEFYFSPAFLLFRHRFHFFATNRAFLPDPLFFDRL